MAKKASRHEEERFILKGSGVYSHGDWTNYEIFPADGKIAVGTCHIRNGGGWLCTLPVFATEDNGIADVRKKVGYVKGRGDTPQEALAEADRLSLMGPEAIERYEQETLA